MQGTNRVDGMDCKLTGTDMAKTYTQVIKQIEALSREADKLKRKEAEGVISRIKEAIASYGLTASDLGLADSASRRGRHKTPGAKSQQGDDGPSRAPRFRDEAGNTWVGRGPRPHWLRDALATGKRLEDFKI